MEYADSGTLRNYLKEHFSKLTWVDKSNLALQLAYAISCLHDEKIVHRDLVIHIDIHYNNIVYIYLFIYIFFSLIIAP